MTEIKNPTCESGASYVPLLVLTLEQRQCSSTRHPMQALCCKTQHLAVNNRALPCGERFQKAGEKFSVINGTTPRTVRLSLYGTAGKGQPNPFLCVHQSGKGGNYV